MPPDPATKERPITKKLTFAALPSQLITLFLLAALAGFQLHKVFSTPMWFDAATVAIAAKSLAYGHGYATVTWHNYYPFAPSITTGPFLVLPAALMIALFGNAYWVPSLSTVLVIIALLCIAAWRLRELLTSRSACWSASAVFLLAASLFTNQFTDNRHSQMSVWHTLLGEVPAALLIIIAAMHIATNRFSARTLFTGGIIAGLATQCKMQSFIDVGVIGIYAAFAYIPLLRKEEASPLQAAKGVLSYGLGAILPQFAFEITKLIALGGWENYADTLRKLYGVMSAVFSSAHQKNMIVPKLYSLAVFVGFVPADTASSLDGLLFRFNATIALLGIVLILCVVGLLRGVFNQASPAKWAAQILLGCGVIHLAWWLFVYKYMMPRYALQPILYACGALALFAGRITLNPSRAARLVFPVICIVILFLRHDALAYLFTDPEKDEALRDEQNAMHRLIALKKEKPDTVIFSCGLSQEMEYLLPTSGNITPCEKLINPLYAGRPHVLLSPYTIVPGAMAYSPSYFAIAQRTNPPPVVELCPKDDLYSGINYAIATCK